MYSIVDRYFSNGQTEWYVRHTNISTIQQAISMMNKDQYVIKTDDLKTFPGKIYWPDDDVITIKL